MRRISQDKTKARRAPPLDDDARWAAVEARDAAFDGLFYFSVVTTGVYCRPSCPARHAKRANVAFHATRAGAEAAGFRPCKRCKPDEPDLTAQRAAKVAEACRLIEVSEEEPNLDALAGAVGLSSYHFHRIFKAQTGVTPKAYATAQRQKRVRDTLKRSATVTEAIYEAGFKSNGRFYDSSTKVLGMTPTDFRAGGANADIRFAIAECSLGSVLVAASDKGVCAILMGDVPEALLADLEHRFPKARLIGGDGAFEKLVAKVIAFVEAPETGLDLPLDIRGTAFQHRVWEALRAIPAGETTTYAEIAARIGAPSSVRAVGGAIAANPIAVAVPCHRVIRTGGALSGYRWGVERKRALLDREKKS